MELRIKKKYIKKVNKRIKKYSDIILDSFIEFYGKEYKETITDRFNDIVFEYYITDYTMFYIYYVAKTGEYLGTDKFACVKPMIPYILYLAKCGFYRQEVTQDNFYNLAINKIIGVSSGELLCESNLELMKYFISLAIRDNNQCPMELNAQLNHGIKRIIALPAFSANDKDLFHEINHAVCAEDVIHNGERLVKCGLSYSNKERFFAEEIINDLLSLDIYNIFKSKCNDTILNNYIMDEALVASYPKFHHLIRNFYEENKERIKLSSLSHSGFDISEEEIKGLSKVLKR